MIAISDVAFLRSDEGDKAFEEAWKALVEERELVCKQTGTRFPALPKPKAAIMDVRALNNACPSRSIICILLNNVMCCSFSLWTRFTSRRP